MGHVTAGGTRAPRTPEEDPARQAHQSVVLVFPWKETFRAEHSASPRRFHVAHGAKSRAGCRAPAHSDTHSASEPTVGQPFPPG